MRILLLEDVGRVASTIVHQLEKEGHDVDLGFSVSRANGYLGENKNKNDYDCLIVDFNMPTTGLTREQAEQSYNGLFTGWIWLRDEVFPKCPELRQRTIVFSAYLNEFKGKMHGENVEGIIMIPKGEGHPANNAFQENRLLAAVRKIVKDVDRER